MRPLAERMRPRQLADYVGQQHLVGSGAVLRQAIESGQIPSFILWGQPGIGKTTLAKIIANELDRPFHTLSAINSGVKDVRETIQRAKSQRFFDSPNPILFIDEIHRFSKSQQDSLLGAVEEGVITLIGATTENPSFEVIPALLSRCQVYVLEPLSKDELIGLIERALKEDEFLKGQKINIEDYDAILLHSGGDARKLYNILELVTNYGKASEPITVTNEMVTQKLQQNISRYDKGGEQHYDIISAFIKSIRGSDPNAAVYWLARMIEAGEDIKFIARRMLILAAEDIGIANPTALVLANSTFQAVATIGYPEGRILLSECAIYLATSPKSNAAYKAIDTALEKVKATGNLQVPLPLRNAPTHLMKEMGYGTGYKYAHDYENQFAEQEFLPEELKGTKLYEPGGNPKEKNIRDFLKVRWKDKYGY